MQNKESIEALRKNPLYSRIAGNLYGIEFRNLGLNDIADDWIKLNSLMSDAIDAGHEEVNRIISNTDFEEELMNLLNRISEAVGMTELLHIQGRILAQIYGKPVFPG